MSQLHPVADEFPLEPLFNFFFSDIHQKAGKGSNKTDLARFLDPTRVATFAWKHSLTASAVFMAANQLLDDETYGSQLTKEERHDLEEACDKVVRLFDARSNRRSMGNGGSLLSSLLIYNVGIFPELIQSIVEEASPSWAATIAKIAVKQSASSKANFWGNTSANITA